MIPYGQFSNVLNEKKAKESIKSRGSNLHHRAENVFIHI